MEASTTINRMIAGNTIFVPTYQRAYSLGYRAGKHIFDGLRRI